MRAGGKGRQRVDVAFSRRGEVFYSRTMHHFSLGRRRLEKARTRLAHDEATKGQESVHW